MRSSSIRQFFAGALRPLAAAVALAIGLAASPATAQQAPAPQSPETFRVEEIVEQGHALFGSISRGLALTVQEAFNRWGEPNGYILGQEAGGAFIGGLRYGEGVLYTRNAGNQRVFWQGPTVGIDFGGEGSRTMMLVYQLPSTNAMYQRFGGMDGSAYLVGGFGMTALTASNIIVVPIRSGVGARLGVNIGYLKFTPEATWNPF
ncbi:MAG: DUF1134 domain-containing protein [Microvirga sp.]|nr:DUF1134 domain-containing protein [Microvirga sp.]